MKYQEDTIIYAQSDERAIRVMGLVKRPKHASSLYEYEEISRYGSKHPHINKDMTVRVSAIHIFAEDGEVVHSAEQLPNWIEEKARNHDWL